VIRNLLLGAAALLAVASGVGDAGAAAGRDTTATTVIMVRHAEKLQHAPGGDSGLDPKGIVRAQELKRTLIDAGVHALYASQYPRARLTAEPLAQALRDSVRTYDANRNDLLAERIRREHRGQTVLVVGHSDSLPEFFEALTGSKLNEGATVAYDRLFVITLLGDGRHMLTRLRYGSPSGN
jgi:broad specificity phosphatase PhoE